MTTLELNTDRPINTANEISPPKKSPIFKILIIASILVSISLILRSIIWIMLFSKKNPNLTQTTYDSFLLNYPKYFKKTLGNPNQIVLKDPEKNGLGGNSTIIFSDISKSNIDISSESKCLQEVKTLKKKMYDSGLNIKFLENVLSPQFRDRKAYYTCRVDMKIITNGEALYGKRKLFFDKNNNKTYEVNITYAEKETQEKIDDITDAFIDSSIITN